MREENEGIVSAATDAAKATLGPGATEEQIELEAIGQCNAILQQ